MITSLKTRLEPNNKQSSKMFGSAGTARWAYNWVIAKQEENYKNGGKFIIDNDLRKELTQLKKTEVFKWLNEYSNNVTKQAVKDGCEAYKKFLKKLSGKPKFKSRKKSKTSFYQDTANTKFTSTHVRLEKIGWVKLSEKSRVPLGSKITNPRVTYDGLHWYISVGIEIPYEEVELTEESIGIDMGLKDLAIVSNIEKPSSEMMKKDIKHS